MWQSYFVGCFYYHLIGQVFRIDGITIVGIHVEILGKNVLSLGTRKCCWDCRPFIFNSVCCHNGCLPKYVVNISYSANLISAS